VDTDEIARELVRPGQPALMEICKQFGDAVLASEGTLNRAALGHIVFNDDPALKRLEAILHPSIRESWQSLVNQWAHENCPLAAVVIPLLFETQAEAQFDKIICVACSSDSQQARLHQRGWSAEQIQRRIAVQLPVEQKMARSDFVVWTEGDMDAHHRQIAEILKKP